MECEQKDRRKEMRKKKKTGAMELKCKGRKRERKKERRKQGRKGGEAVNDEVEVGKSDSDKARE